VFLLRAVESLSVVETAKALEVSVSTVKTRMRRARRELKDILQNKYKPSAARPASEDVTSLMAERRFQQPWLT
jgi:transposase